MYENAVASLLSWSSPCLLELSVAFNEGRLIAAWRLRIGRNRFSKLAVASPHQSVAAAMPSQGQGGLSRAASAPCLPTHRHSRP